MIRVIILLLLCASCSTARRAPIGTTVKDSLYISSRLIDRVVLRDSVYERVRNDTTYIYKEREIVKHLALHDTVYISRVDSIPYPVEVERSLSRWEMAKVDFGGWAILLLVAIGWFAARRR